MNKNRAFLVLMLLALLLSIPAAGYAQEHEPVTINFWHHWGGNRVPLMEQQIAAFQAANPWITVNMTLQPWEQRLETLLTSVAAGDPPHVTMLGRQDLPSFVLQNALTPLDEFMERDGITADMFLESEWRGAQYNGQTWILPQPTGGALNIAWYNKTMFAEAGLDPESFPDTWEQLWEAGRALTIQTDGFLDRVGVNVHTTGGETPAFVVWLNANGGDWLSEDGRTILFNSPQGVEALQFMVDFTNEINGGIEEVQSFYSQTGEWENGPFYNNYEAIMLNGSWALFLIQDFSPDIEFGIAPLPVGPSGNPDVRGTAWGGWGYTIPRNDNMPEGEREAAWLLTKWLTTEIEGDGACWFIQQQQRPSPLSECDGYLLDGVTHPRAEDILNVMAYDRWVPIAPIQPQLNEVITNMTDEAMFGVKSAEQAVADGAASAQALLDAFWAEQDAS
jgi:multiple sugar transport system substrate-binding protein